MLGLQMDQCHIHTKVLPSFGCLPQTAGIAIMECLYGNAYNKLLVVGARGTCAPKQCAIAVADEAGRR